jgi:transposase
MACGRPLEPIRLSPAGREELLAYERSRTLPGAVVLRARVILRAAEGASNSVIAEQLGLSKPTVGHWRRRYLRQGVQGLHDSLRPGGPRSIGKKEVETLLQLLITSKPKSKTHWTCRALATETGVSKSGVHRLLRAVGLQLPRQKTRLFAGAPNPQDVVDIVGLYLNPPDYAMVLCYDEPRHVSEHDQALLAENVGYVKGAAPEYGRHGTETLFDALDLASGEKLTPYRHRDRDKEFAAFLRRTEAAVPTELAVLLVVGNFRLPGRVEHRRWLAVRRRFQLRSTSSYASWLNQVKIWFEIVLQRAFRRGTFRSVQDFVAKIEVFAQDYKRRSVPFAWVATHDSIQAKVARLRNGIAGASR